MAKAEEVEEAGDKVAEAAAEMATEAMAVGPGSGAEA